MKRIYTSLCAVAIALTITSSARAQDQSQSIRPITTKGTMAMEFAFGGLSSMQMGAVDLAQIFLPSQGEGGSTQTYLAAAGVKYYIADELALRGLLAFSTSTSGDPDPTKSSNGKDVQTLFGIGVGVEMHTHPVYAVSPYFGAQLTFATSGLTNTKNQVDRADSKDASTLATTTVETKSSGNGIGIGLLAGFDWYVTHGIAIGAEYTLGFSTSSTSETVSGTTTDYPSTTMIGIASGNIHMLVHF
ncbi:MAG: outer membrane beta-barrel protein [Bacteroidetes bacterium]|nr:outer membrane beta-barrel protein [Bacteroidota bacterium]